MASKFLSVVIPAYNEAKNVDRGVLNEVAEYLTTQKYSWEILLVDDGSIDSTLESLYRYSQKHKNVRVLAEPHRGKGGTVIAGMLQAEGDIILFTDFDQATPLPQIEKFLPHFEEGYDVVIGSRSGRKGAPIIRKLMAYGFSLLRLIILRLPYKDTQCGFKAFKKEAAKKIFSKMKIYNDKVVAGAAVTAGFDLELLYLARKLKLKVKEVEVNWIHQETEKINPIKDSLDALSDLLRVRFNSLTGKYK